MPLPKIPDSVLERLQCQCGRYLSTSPINVNQDGKSVCSTCAYSGNFDVGEIARNSAYETIAELFRFPCRYKSKGCSKYMQFNIIAKHEEECTFRTYECPQNLLTYCNTVDSIAQLCNHYQQQHPEFYLSSPTLAVDLTIDSERYYFTTVDNYTYLLQTRCSIKQNKLWLHVVHFRNSEDTMYIHYQIKITDANNRNRCVELEEKCAEAFNNVRLNQSQAVEVDISAITSLFNCTNCVCCSWDITVAEELKRRTMKQKDLEDQEIFEEKKESIRCPYCRLYMIPPIYRCDKRHIACEECRNSYNDCRSCQSNQVTWTRATDIENIVIKMAQYRCRWLKCNKMFSCNEIRIHEQECSYRRYKCPNCNWLGVYDDIILHFQSTHSGIKIYSGSTIIFDSNDRYVFIVAHHEMFVFSIKKETQNRLGVLGGYVDLSFEVNYLGFPKFVNDWQFIINQENVSVNTPHHLVKLSNNHYVGNISVSELTHTGYSYGSMIKTSIGNYQLSIIKK